MTGLEFCNTAHHLGYDFFTGVPDSILKTILCTLESDPRFLYVPAIREDSAFGVAVGAYLGGRMPMVLLQSSGVGHSLDALASLALLYRIPLLSIIGWRGSDQSDAPEHLLMGALLLPLLAEAKIPFLVPDVNDVSNAMADLCSKSRSLSIMTALVLRHHIVS